MESMRARAIDTPADLAGAGRGVGGATLAPPTPAPFVKHPPRARLPALAYYSPSLNANLRRQLCETKGALA